MKERELRKEYLADERPEVLALSFSEWKTVRIKKQEQQIKELEDKLNNYNLIRGVMCQNCGSYDKIVIDNKDKGITVKCYSCETNEQIKELEVALKTIAFHDIKPKTARVIKQALK